jgi:hypothetical protein
VIYVNVEGVKSEGRGVAGGNHWHDTDDVAGAVVAELRAFHATYDALGHGAVVTYNITVAPESSPRRTTPQRWPLPVSERKEARDGR